MNHTIPDPHLHLHGAMEEAEQELIAIHQRIVQVPSVNWGDGSSAREDAVAQVMTDYLTPYGIASRTREGALGRANFLARLSGNAENAGRSAFQADASLKSRPADENGEAASPGRTLLFMSHSDVVPPGEKKSWRFPPFSAHIADGRIWGRGSNDCKMLVAAQLFTMAILARLKLLERGELRLAVGADEEAGGKWGFGWLAEHESDFLKADLAINEGGGAFFGRTREGAPLFLVGCGEKGRSEVSFTAAGPGTHASVPWGKANPLARLAQLIERVAAWEGAAYPASPVFQTIRRCMELDGACSTENLAETIQEARRRYSLSFHNSLMAQSRMTIVPTVLTAGEKSNAVPARATLVCDARILPGQTREDLDQAIKRILADFPDIAVQVSETARSSVSAADPEIEQLFQSALKHTFASDAASAEPAILPTWCTGFTDSRFVRDLGTPAYGFQVVEPAADPDKLSIHCIDESIEVGMLLPCAQALGHFALDFCAKASQ